MMIDLLNKLDGVRPCGGGWTALCPAHPDRNSSLKVDQEDDRWLVHCYAGCGFDEVIGALGLTVADLFDDAQRRQSPSTSRPKAKPSRRNGNGTGSSGDSKGDAGGSGSGLTLATYAEAKKLRVGFLRALGISDDTWQGTPAISIPYLNADGEMVAMRYRISISGDKFRWRKGDKPVLYGQEQLELARAAGEITIVEGESDSHVLWQHSITAIGLPGARSWDEERDAPLFDGIAVINIVIEPDKGGETVLEWVSQSKIRDRVRLVSLPTKDPADLHVQNPDAFVQHWQAACLNAIPWSDAEQPDATAKDARAGKKFNSGSEPPSVSVEDFYAYMPMHSYIFAPTRETWPAASVNSVFGKGTSRWLDQNRAVEQMTWAPGEPELIKDRLIADGRWIPRQGATCYNLYLPPTAVTRGDPAKAKQWLDHLHCVYPDDAAHILKYLAHRVQAPHEKINHALVLGGPQEVGKDTILEPVKRAVGAWNFIETSPQQMLGQFNGFAKAVIIRVSEARDLGDRDRFAFYDHMKVYTATPPDVLRVNEKHLREYAVLNVCGVVITTNHKTDGLYLPKDDRRHYVTWTNLNKDDFAIDYWKKLYTWYDHGGIEHVAAYLVEFDIADFDPKAPPPKTQAFWDIVDASRAPEDDQLADALDCIANPDVTTLEEIYSSSRTDAELCVWLRDRRNSRLIPHRMETVGYVAVRSPSDKTDGRWKVGHKRQVIYGKASLSLPDRHRAAAAFVEARRQ